MEYIFERLTDTSCLHDFCCGAYIVKESLKESTVLALFALSFDSLDLDIDDRNEIITGVSNTNIPEFTDNYKDIFLTKPRYPALEIAYLAVDKNYHKSGLGKIIVEAIVQKAQKQDLAGCQFITVEALNTQEYNAVGFYDKCCFSACEYPNPNKGTLRMFRTLYPVS